MSGKKFMNKSKRYSDGILAWAKDRGKIVIVVHDNPDPDCLASAMALRHLFMQKLKKDAVITFSGMIGRSENIAMAKALNLTLTPLEMVDLSRYGVICMLDTQPGTGNNSLPPQTSVDILIDHHPLREASRRCSWVDVREDYGATASILYEYLLAQDVSIGPKLATALFYAVRSETQELGREANRPDREAYLQLFPRARQDLLYEITHPKLPVEYFLTINKAIDTSMIYGNVLVAALPEIIFPEIVAEMADFLLRMEDVETVLCSGRYNDEVIISLRTIRTDVNMGDIIRQLVSGKGNAGGHGMTAGGKIGIGPSDGKTVEDIQQQITVELLCLLEMDKSKPRKLLR